MLHYARRGEVDGFVAQTVQDAYTHKALINRAKKQKRTASLRAPHRPQNVRIPPSNPRSRSSTSSDSSSSSVDDPIAQQPQDPVHLSRCSQVVPKPPAVADLLRENGCLEWQIHMARHLAANGSKGPFEIGEYLCTVRRRTGEIVKRAQRIYDCETGRFQWQDVHTLNPIEQDMSVNGAFGAYQGSMGSFHEVSGCVQFSYIPPASRHTHNTRAQEALKYGYDPMWF